MNIFQVISNIKHNGDLLQKGDFIEAEIAELEHLVKAGVLRLFSLAKSVEEAKGIVEAEGAEQPTATQEVAEPKGTWGPTEPEAPAQQPADEKVEAEVVTPEPVKAEDAPAQQPEAPAEPQESEPAKPAEDSIGENL